MAGIAWLSWVRGGTRSAHCLRGGGGGGGRHLVEGVADFLGGRQHEPVREADRVQVQDVVERDGEEALFRDEVDDLALPEGEASCELESRVGGGGGGGAVNLYDREWVSEPGGRLWVCAELSRCQPGTP